MGGYPIALVPVHGWTSLAYMDGLLDFASVPVLFSFEEFGVDIMDTLCLVLRQRFIDSCRVVKFGVFFESYPQRPNSCCSLASWSSGVLTYNLGLFV